MSETARLKATLQDVARTAGVSLATVDRVVNRRDGVRGKTVARVEAALAKLGYRPDAAAARLARNQTFRFAFILPTGANSFMTNLDEQVRRTADWLPASAPSSTSCMSTSSIPMPSRARSRPYLRPTTASRPSRSIIRRCEPPSTTWPTAVCGS